MYWMTNEPVLTAPDQVGGGEIEKTFHLGADRPTQRVEETSIRFAGDFDATAYGKLVRHAFFMALALDTKAPLWIKQMEGGSGRKYRYFINNLVQIMDDARYLEIGSYKGSTLCSAAYGNTLSATCIDYWNQFGGREDFDENIARLKVETPTLSLTVIESDMRLVDFSNIGKFNIYCFDGDHKEDDHYDALAITQDALDEPYILIIDDWVMPAVPAGTMRALRDTNSRILASITIETTQNGQLPTLLGSWFSDWHNGYFIAIVKKG
jgi:hypothetical protein